MAAEEPVAKNGEGLGSSIMSGRHEEDVGGVGLQLVQEVVQYWTRNRTSLTFSPVRNPYTCKIGPKTGMHDPPYWMSHPNPIALTVTLDIDNHNC